MNYERMKKEEDKKIKVYNLIEDINSNIKVLIPVYVEHNKNNLSNDSIKKINLFSNIRIYGGLENPKYHLKDVSELLGVSDPISKTKDFDDDERELAFVINDVNKKTKKKFLLTENGLQRFIYQSNTDVGKLFRKCIKYIIDELFTKRYITMEEVEDHIENKHLELYKKTVITLKKNASKLKHKNKMLQNRLEIYIDSEDSARGELKDIKNRLDQEVDEKIKTENELKTLKKDYKTLENESIYSFDYLQRQEIIALQKKHTKPIYIYLEEFPLSSIVKKKINIPQYKYCEQEEQLPVLLGIDAYKIDDFRDGVVPNFEDTMLYNIYNKKNTRKSRILMHTIYGSSNEIFELLAKRMYYIKGPYINNYTGSDVLLCSIEDIKLEFENIIIGCTKKGNRKSED